MKYCSACLYIAEPGVPLAETHTVPVVLSIADLDGSNLRQKAAELCVLCLEEFKVYAARGQGTALSPQMNMWIQAMEEAG